MSNTARLAWILGLAVACSARAELRMSPLFASDMVIQRETMAPIWGWGEPGETVTVTASWGESATATTGENGRWLVRLRTPEAGGPHTITLQGSNTLTLTNVLSGDVWLCGGQSNMEWALCMSANAKEEIAAANYPGIRHFNVKHNAQPEPAETCEAEWATCTSENADWFTAVGYHFGRVIHTRTEIPIGLLSINWGGARLEPWAPPAAFESVPELAAYAEEHNDKEFGNAHPSAMYNGMIAPLLPFAMKGAIWYQGESNQRDGRDGYRAKLTALINGWRKVWNQGPFPFYIAQLSTVYSSDPANPFTRAAIGWPKVQMAQLDIVSRVENTGLAVTVDIGEDGKMHPRNKQDVGKRLALWALARDYGEKDLVCSGPLYRDMEFVDNKAILHFDHVGSGLMVGRKNGLEPAVEDKATPLKWFAVRQGRAWHWGTAVIEGDTVVVAAPAPGPISEVRYAYAINPEGANLYNREGLPASPFTTAK